MTRIIVSDTGPLLHLSEAGAVDLLSITTEALPTGDRETPLVMRQHRRISFAVEVKWIEREYQYIIC